MKSPLSRNALTKLYISPTHTRNPGLISAPTSVEPQFTSGLAKVCDFTDMHEKWLASASFVEYTSNQKSVCPCTIFFLKWAIHGLFFFIFIFQYTVDNKQTFYLYKFWPMTVFELWTSAIGSNRPINWATTTIIFPLVIFRFTCVGRKKWKIFKNEFYLSEPCRHYRAHVYHAAMIWQDI